MELRDLEVALEAERQRAAQRLVDADAEFEEIVAATRNANADDEHDPEGSTIAYERARVATLRAKAVGSLAVIEGQLARLRRGTHISCERCGAEIVLERIAAVPTTRHCIACVTTRTTRLSRGD
ncbi:MAG: TraR/DksA C4-type zinc finger protein [Actinomycetota bacterium]|nr:TraR/DksA C4-type zinc finger protein [Actinomycetota bacterium]